MRRSQLLEYLEQLAKLAAEENIRWSTVVSVPHMGGKRGKRQRAELMRRWRQTALDIERDVRVLHSAAELHSWAAEVYEDEENAA